MRNEPAEIIKYMGYEIKIYQDDGPTNPRENDHLGTMLCKHSRYNLGDTKESQAMSPDEIKVHVNRKDVISLPLYILDHSGICMKTSFINTYMGWDTSMVGWITVKKSKALKEWNKKKWTKLFEKKILSVLESEVREYSDYLEGNVYGYIITQDGEKYDSRWGFYPDHSNDGDSNGLGYMIEGCQSIIRSYVISDHREAII